jgi:cyanate permease
VAATVVSFFSALSGVASIGFGLIPRRVPIRFRLAAAGLLLFGGTLALQWVDGAISGYIAAGMFGAGVGGLLVMLPIAWADYYGRRSYGAIRGVALSIQVLAQASGPLLSGALRDATGGYEPSLLCFAVLSGMSVLAALAARPPGANRSSASR